LPHGFEKGLLMALVSRVGISGCYPALRIRKSKKTTRLKNIKKTGRRRKAEKQTDSSKGVVIERGARRLWSVQRKGAGKWLPQRSATSSVDLV